MNTTIYKKLSVYLSRFNASHSMNLILEQDVDGTCFNIRVNGTTIAVISTLEELFSFFCGYEAFNYINGPF